ncbi:MAG: HNH endonuclease [Ardenticatenaceae bacterium]|nr:HNH endonuclease [Ardenticatenaceae bacterium]
MSSSARLRQRIAKEAGDRYGYCQTQEVVSGIPLTLEHIISKVRGGQDNEENLWLSCRLCNESKGKRIEAVDPKTGESVPLYNPRTQDWATHFAWSEDGTQIIGQTAVGRATVEALSLNDDLRVRARAIWVEAGYHPPDQN